MGKEDTLQTQTGSLPVNQGAATLRLHPLDDDVRLFQTRTLKETKEKVADSPSGWGLRAPPQGTFTRRERHWTADSSVRAAAPPARLSRQKSSGRSGLRLRLERNPEAAESK